MLFKQRISKVIVVFFPFDWANKASVLSELCFGGDVSINVFDSKITFVSARFSIKVLALFHNFEQSMPMQLSAPKARLGVPTE